MKLSYQRVDWQVNLRLCNKETLASALRLERRRHQRGRKTSASSPGPGQCAVVPCARAPLDPPRRARPRASCSALATRRRGIPMDAAAWMWRWSARMPLLLSAPGDAGCHAMSVPELPEDVARLVLERLSAARDVAVARAVCRRWRVIVDSSKIIWRGLRFDAIPRSHSAAATYYRKAAANGNERAAILLTLLYSYGWRPHAIESRANRFFAVST
jgi:F-box-like